VVSGERVGTVVSSNGQLQRAVAEAGEPVR
jgi:hypothetical protein